jgi:hypothetical protein
VFAILVYGMLFLYASPSLRLEGGKSSRFWSYVGRRIGLAATVGLLVVNLNAARAMAFQQAQPQAEPSQPTEAGAPQRTLQISIDLDYKTVKAGDAVLYNTVVKNNGTSDSPPLGVAMNIINLDAAGDIVDPEDWSPQRTQYLESLAAGQSVTFSWRVNAILDGDYLVYMVLIPEPTGETATTQPIVSSAIHLTVTPFTKLNPGGVLPYAIGGPLVLLLGMSLLNRHRRRQIDKGGSR